MGLRRGSPFPSCKWILTLRVQHTESFVLFTWALRLLFTHALVCAIKSEFDRNWSFWPRFNNTPTMKAKQEEFKDLVSSWWKQLQFHWLPLSYPNLYILSPGRVINTGDYSLMPPYWYICCCFIFNPVTDKHLDSVVVWDQNSFLSK